MIEKWPNVWNVEYAISPSARSVLLNFYQKQIRIWLSLSSLAYFEKQTLGFNCLANALILLYLLKNLEINITTVKLMNFHQDKIYETKDCFRSCATGFLQVWSVCPGFFSSYGNLLTSHFISLLVFPQFQCRKQKKIQTNFSDS